MEFYSEQTYPDKISDDVLAERIRLKLAQYQRNAGRAQFNAREIQRESTREPAKKKQPILEVNWLG